MIAIEISGGKSGLDALAPEWEAILADSFTKVFSHPAWYRAWMESFPTHRTTWIAGREAGELVGVLPLSLTPADYKSLYLRQVAPMARADYQPPVIRPGRVATALPALLDAAVAHFGRRRPFWWPGVPAGDPGLDVLRRYFRDRSMLFAEERAIAPRFRRKASDDYAAVERSWTASHRTDVRRQRKRLAAVGPVQLWQPATLPEAEPVLEEFFRIHDEKWLSEGYPGRFQSSAQRTHYAAMLRHLWGRGVHFSTVRCGETHVSYHFGFFSGGWLQWYRPTYRREFSNYSPSKVHLALLVEEACRSGWQGIDLLLGAEPYKSWWSNETLEVIDFEAGFHGWNPGYLWFTRGRPYVRKRLLPAQMRAIAWLQQRFRRR